MKEFAALILFIVLIAVGWNQPFKVHFQSITGAPPSAPELTETTPPFTPQSPRQASLPSRPGPGVPAVAASATPIPEEKSWMWQKTPMDAPYKEKRGR